MSSPGPINGKRAKNPGRMWSRAVLAKYWAIQLPATLLVTVVLIGVGHRFAWPLWIVWGIAALWVIKDAILYPFLWRAYDYGDPAVLPYPLEGAEGVAVDPIDPSGRVRVGGELWRAELARGTRGIEEGETIQVKARRGLTLLVEPKRDL